MISITCTADETIFYIVRQNTIQIAPTSAIIKISAQFVIIYNTAVQRENLQNEQT